MSDPKPPRLPRRLFERSLPEDVREGIVGDLDEVYRSRRTTHGFLSMLIWYCWQAISISTRLGSERMRDRMRRLGSSAALDLRLGFRMLLKYPMLTVVGGLAITVGAAVGIGVSEFVRDVLFPTMPLEQGDRIVRLANDGAATTLYDFMLWKEDLESVVEVGATRLTELGAVSEDGRTGAVRVAQITASAFPLARVDAQIGRVLTEADEREDAPAIVVLGYESWQEMFDGDSRAIGQVLQLGGAPTTVVGVMPEGYAFPSNAGAWVPLRFRPSDAVPGGGRSVTVFGRLADDVSLDEARAEMSTMGERTAADHPDTHGESRAELVPFASPFGSADSFLVTAVFNGLRLFLVLLLAIPCVNVATLVFARTVTREGEIAVRMSLGATRRRIVVQLFAEALVLVSAATLLSLFIVRWGLSAVAENFFIIQQEGGLPFGWNERLSVPTILYAGLISLAAAVVIGVVPALKATRGAVQPRLSELSTGTISRLKFGGIWTAIIVIQVAFSVAFLPLAVTQADVIFGFVNQNQAEDNGFPASEYVTAQLGRDAIVPPTGAAERAEFLEVSRQLFEDVKTRIAADPRVESVAFASGLFAMNHLTTPVELVGDGASPATAGRARTLLVEPAYLEMMGARVLAGRGLQPADFAPGARAVVVNQTFVDQVLAGRNAVGGQLRYPDRCGADGGDGCESSGVAVPAVGETFEVVGVVANPGMDAFATGDAPAVYAPLSLAPVDARALGLVGMPEAPATQLFVHLRPGSGSITTLLYDVIASVDPSLRISELATLEDTWKPVHQGARLGIWILMIVAGVVLMLSALGIYALMSFTVSQRTREIAIRQAMGAAPRRVLASIFTRSLLQLGLGVLVGLLIAFPVIRSSGSAAPKTVMIVASLLFVTGLVSCLVPIRRALRIQPAMAVKSG
jgi:putative ABC transport system permease protein